MIFVENFRIALLALRINLLRSILTTLGIVIGVAAVIAVVSIVQGMQHVLTSQFQGVGSNLITVVPYQRQGIGMLARQVKLTWEDGLALRDQLSGIEVISPLLLGREMVKFRDRQYRPGLIAGVNGDYPEIQNHGVEIGRFLMRVDLERRRKVAVVGKTVIEELELGDALGQEIVVAGVPVTIIGVMEERGRALGQDSDDVVFLPYDTALNVFGRKAGDQTFIQIKVATADQVGEVRDGIVRILRDRHGLKQEQADDFTVQVQDEVLDAVRTTLGTVTAVVAAIVGVALLVGGIGIMNIMLVSVTERTREIGLRKSVGARKTDILVQFLIEAITLSLIGGTLGVLIGYGIGALAAYLLPGGWPAAYVPPWALALAFGFCTLVGVIFGIYPAGKAAQLDPIEALRYE